MALPIAGMAIMGGLNLASGLLQQDAKNKALAKQRKLLVENFNADISAIKQQFQLNKENAFYDKQASQMQKTEAIADTTINAADAGFSGISINEVFANIEMQTDFRNRVQERNLDLMAQNLDTQAFNKYSELKANIASLKSQKVSNFDVAMGTISGAIQGAQIQQSFAKT